MYEEFCKEKVCKWKIGKIISNINVNINIKINIKVN
jgi:hypothetical protein